MALEEVAGLRERQDRGLHARDFLRQHHAGMAALMSARGRPLEAHFPLTAGATPDAEPERVCTLSG